MEAWRFASKELYENTGIGGGGEPIQDHFLRWLSKFLLGKDRGMILVRASMWSTDEKIDTTYDLYDFYFKLWFLPKLDKWDKTQSLVSFRGVGWWILLLWGELG